MTESTSTVSRRTFVKGSLAGMALAGAAGSALYGCAPKSEEDLAATGDAAAPIEPDTISWSQCNVNCGGNCIFQWHSRDGKVVYMETDNTGDTDLQARACPRGRSMRRWLNSPDRLMYPMKRVGKRGEGKFEQISWDEAIDTIAEKLKYTIDTYGNEAIHLIYATGMYSTTGNPSARLLNLLGGFLARHYDYSTHMISAAVPYMFGDDCSYGGVVFQSPMMEAVGKSDLLVMFGNSPAETRMGGANTVWDFARLREDLTTRGGKIINIDPRMNESCSGHPDEWVPITPGTDAALVAAIAHEWIADGKVDKEFLDTYCVGFDEDTMPDSAKGQSKSYKDYVMGTGYDMVEKTPEWAAPITGIPATKIREIAADIAAAEVPFICQGWGSQRHTNGEPTSLAICLIPLLLGKVGLPGTNTGVREALSTVSLVGGIPAGENAVKVTVPAYQWLNAVDHGHEMNETNAGIKGGSLSTDIKFIWNYAGNCLTNQHGDINYTHEVLADENKCEFILVWDTVMTDSAKYADILLPDAMRSEQLNMQTQGYSEWYTGVTVGGPAQEAPGECRCSYDVMAEIADRLGVGDQFTEGRTHDEWVQFLYEEGAAADSQMPTWEQIKEQGVYKRPLETTYALKDFREDPAANALMTPSGKIEIYSEQLANLNEAWELPEGEQIFPIPVFYPGFHGYGSTTDEYPLYCCGFHHKSRTHSSYGFIPELEAVARQQLWINPVDAEPRGIADGDMLAVASPAGEIRIEAKVTPRVIPGTVMIPQGAWHKADMAGNKVDEGACVNTLTVYHPTALGKGNGTHSMIVQVAKA